MAPSSSPSAAANSVTNGAYSPDGSRILTTSRDHTARIWDATTGKPLLTLTGHTGSVTSGAYSPDGSRILTTGEDRTAQVWDAATGEPLLTLTDHTMDRSRSCRHPVVDCR